MKAFRLLKEAGHTKQKVKRYMPLNVPGETPATLLATIERIRELYRMFGRDNVLPFIFFIGVQPGTPIEKLLVSQGYLKPDYDPLTLNSLLKKPLPELFQHAKQKARFLLCFIFKHLPCLKMPAHPCAGRSLLKNGVFQQTVNPFLIKKLLYNPKPLGRVLGQAYLEALDSPDAGGDYIGRATMEFLERRLADVEWNHVDHARLIESMRQWAMQLCPWCRSHGH
jgi:hypothetical protein